MRGIFLFILFPFFLSAQTVNLTMASRLTVSNVVGSNPFTITATMNDCLSRFTVGNIMVNDSLYFIEGSELVVLTITGINSISLGVINFIAFNPLGTGITPSGGEAIIVRPTPNMKLPPFVCNARPDLQAMVQNRLANLIDNGLAATITSFTRAGGLINDTLRIVEQGITHSLIVPDNVFANSYYNQNLSVMSLIGFWRDYDVLVLTMGATATATSNSDVLLPFPVDDTYLGKSVLVYSIDEHSVHNVRVNGGGVSILPSGTSSPVLSYDVPNRHIAKFICIKEAASYYWLMELRGVDYDPNAAAGGDLSGPLSNLQINAGAIVTADIADTTVTFAKVQKINTNRLLGRSTAGSGSVEQISIGSNLLLTGGVLSAVGGDSAIVSGKGTIGRIPAWKLSPTNLGDSYMDVVDSITHARGGIVTYNKSTTSPALEINGVIKDKYISVTSDTTLTANINTVFVDCTAGPIGLTLSSPATSGGWKYYIRKTDTTGNPIIIYADWIGGSGQKVIYMTEETIEVKSNNVKWFLN